ncbi:unnamed protein product [Rhizoctonia solani]|uniref:AA9 family lytic polysaccharide monooxygenase n=1 Tax=Rhizoctonia solani TaxID=456999 RepID=A0A8H3E6H4_9AGAM|nr:unnamed protein product [Rhizoctonia solani]
MRTGTIIAALAVASTAHAHATFQQLWVDGADQGSKCVRTPANNSPITDVTSNTLACNVNGEVAASATCTVPAGGKVAVEMHQHNDRECSKEAIGGNHDGPTIVYMAKVENAATAVGSEANWFKVAETGLVSKDYWGTDTMNANCGKVEFTVPADIPAGNYLIRAEVIALHVAGSSGGAQFYMSCYQINVTGGGAASPATVKFPGAYSATDPGILFNMYGAYSSYTIPGPPIGGSGGANPGPPAASGISTSTAADTNSAAYSTEIASTSTTSQVTPSLANTAYGTSTDASTKTTSTGVVSTSIAESTSGAAYSTGATSSAIEAYAPPSPIPTAGTTSASAIATEAAGISTTTSSCAVSATSTSTTTGPIAKFDRCGGSGWTGGTTCVSGTTCVVHNPYYSQCL